MFVTRGSDDAFISGEQADVTYNNLGRSLTAASAIRSLKESSAWLAGTPLFLVPDGLAEVCSGPALIQRLRADLPVHELAGGSPSDPPARTLNAAAARYVHAIRTIQPQGPYRLAGGGLGGMVAYEVATQLVAHDQAVEFLALIGTDGPGSRPLRGADWPAACPAPHRRIVEEALAQYAPQRIPVRLHLFVPSDDAVPHGALVDPPMGWSDVLPHEQLEVIPVPWVQRPLTSSAQIDMLGAAISNVLKKVSLDPSLPRASDYLPLLTIQPGQKDHAPLFCIPGAGGNITSFIALAVAMGSQWPLHGLQPRGLEHGQVPHASVQAAATCYVQALLKQCPDGHCHLLGHSFGGWVAFEMAIQLRSTGRSPLSITLVDTQAPTCGAAPEVTRIDVLMSLVELIELGLPRSMNLSHAQFARLGCAQQLALLHERMVAENVMPARSTPGDLSCMLQTLSMNLRTAYTPTSVSMEPVHLVLATDTRLAAQASVAQQLTITNGWHRWAPNLRSWLGPGNHLTILRLPHVEALANRIRT